MSDAACKTRTGARVAEGSGLLSRPALSASRGFESHSVRSTVKSTHKRGGSCPPFGSNVKRRRGLNPAGLAPPVRAERGHVA